MQFCSRFRQIIIIEFLGKFTSTVRLNWKLWLVSLGIGLVRSVQLINLYVDIDSGFKNIYLAQLCELFTCAPCMSVQHVQVGRC